MPMPPENAYKGMLKKLCESGREISINQTWRYSTHIVPHCITTHYEVCEWKGKKVTRLGYFTKKIELFNFLVNETKEL